MYCTQCGQDLPDDARFCSRCGAPAHPGKEPATTPHDVTTGALDTGALDALETVEDLPQLAPGTGMLVVVRGPNAGARFLVDRDVTTIGRHPDSHMFLDDVTVSRRHAEIRRRGDDLSVHDLGSLNGTYVNGDRVEERLLRTGDEVQVGRFKLLFVGASGA